MKIKVLLTALLTLTSAIAATYGYASSWSAVEDGQIIGGNHQITCGEGPDWQECGTPPPQNCNYAYDDMIIMLGYQDGTAPPSTFKSLPYSFQIAFTVRSGGLAKINKSKNVTANKVLPIKDISFTETDGSISSRKYSSYVENEFRNLWGNSFIDVSHVKLVAPDGRTVSPGRLREVYDMEAGQYSGYNLFTWFMHEICEVD